MIKLQLKNCNMILNRRAEKISALSTGKINKYKYVTGGEIILPSDQRWVIEQAKSTYSTNSEAFEKQTKTIEYQEEKQMKAIISMENNLSCLMVKNIF